MEQATEYNPTTPMLVSINGVPRKEVVMKGKNYNPKDKENIRDKNKEDQIIESNSHRITTS
jgi:hypothetical protein